MAGQRNIRIDTDADFEYGVHWGDGTAWFELSDVSFVVYTENDPTDVLLEANVGNNLVVLGSAPDWWATILVPVEELETAFTDIDVTTADYRIVATRDSDGRRRKLLEGKVSIKHGPDTTP